MEKTNKNYKLPLILTIISFILYILSSILAYDTFDLIINNDGSGEALVLIILLPAFFITMIVGTIISIISLVSSIKTTKKGNKSSIAFIILNSLFILTYIVNFILVYII